jgi:RecB family exonuclease
VARTLRGAAAVRFLIDQLHSESAMSSRFGEPCVFIGSTAEAGGLSFAAVRLVGLAEGALPHTPHDDPILPDALLPRIEELARGIHADVILPRLSDRVLDEIHDAYRVINGARQRLALSAPRQWTDRSDREVSGVMLEVATALGRDAAGAGDDVPTSGRLRSAYFGPGRGARTASGKESPLTPRSLLASVIPPASTAADTLRVPASWVAGTAIDAADLQRLAEIRDAGELCATDGVLAQTWKAVEVPGVGKQPLSASALNVLLSCPHRFMLERLMHLAPPAVRPSTDTIEPVIYGALFHAVVERFLRAAGPALCRREGELDDWIARAEAIAAAELDELCHIYPLRGADALERERARLLRQIRQLVEYEWKKAPREFIATEQGFGEPEPLRLGGDAGLGVRGAIDRIDRMPAGGLAVRDIKTGRMQDLADEPVNAGRDLQIGLYTLALEAGGSEHVVEAGYVHPSAVHEQERLFTGVELDRLRQQTLSWLHTAREILVAGMFVRTPLVDDCRFCPFVPACGEDAHSHSAAKLAALSEPHPLARLVRLKREKSGDE